MSSRDIQRRLKELAAALQAEPGSIPRRLELSAALREAGRPADAIDLYRGVAEVYAEEGRLVQAMAVCKGMLEIDPGHRDTLEMLATLAQRRAAKRGSAEIRQVDGRWVAEPSQPNLLARRIETPRAEPHVDLPTPPNIADLAPGRRTETVKTREPSHTGSAPWSESSTRAGDAPDSTRVGEEEVSDVRSAMWSRTPPDGVPAVDVEVDLDLSDGPPKPPERELATIRTTMPDELREDAPAALDFPPETKKLARGDTLRELSDGDTVRQRRVTPLPTVRMANLSDEELAAIEAAERHDTPLESEPFDVEGLPRTPTSDTNPAFGAPRVRAATPAGGTIAGTRRALEAAGGARPNNALAATSDEGGLYDEDPGNTLIQDVLTAPFPRAALLVEPPPFPLLSELPRGAFMELLARLTVLRLEAGHNVLREGEVGDACYLIASGAVRVTKAGVAVAVLGPGSFFGEFAVLADQRRHASVETIEPVELLEIRRALLDELVAAHPGVARTLRKFYRERLLQTLTATAPFFARLSPEERASIAERFRPRRFGRGARIIEEGSPGGGLFLILVGEVQVVRGPADAEVLLGSLGEGSYFGEMSLLRGGTASATVRASRMTEVVQLPPRDFYEVVSQHPVLWEQLRSEAERREMANHAIVAGEARKSDDGTIYLV